MKNINLLSKRQVSSNANEGVWEDLGLDVLKKVVLANDNLYEAFRDVVKQPLTDLRKITERQDILKDFLNYPGLTDDILGVCLLSEKLKKAYSHISGTLKERFEDYLDLNFKLIELIYKMHNILRFKEFSSENLSSFQKQVSEKDKYEELKKYFLEAFKYWDTKCITFAACTGESFKLKNANIISTKNIKSQAEYKKGFFKKVILKEENNNSFFYGDNFIIDTIVENDITAAGIVNLCAAVSQVNSSLFLLFKNIADDLLFYKGSIKIIKYLEEKGLKYCFPVFDSTKPVIIASNLYDLGLAAGMEGEIKPVCNDIADFGGNIFFLTGPNQGGKTTFIKSIGISQLFAQAGIFAAAEKYECPVYSGIVTHFPKEEDMGQDFGKLAEELTRLKNDFLKVRGGGLILLNESFATTTEEEGSEIALDVLKALSKTNSCIFFVTHFYKMAKNLEKVNKELFNGAKAISLIALFDSQQKDYKRSYKIVKGDVQENIHAIEFINKT